MAVPQSVQAELSAHPICSACGHRNAVSYLPVTRDLPGCPESMIAGLSFWRVRCVSRHPLSGLSDRIHGRTVRHDEVCFREDGQRLSA